MFENQIIYVYSRLIKYNIIIMASINQLISEIAHSVQQSDSVPVRRAIRLAIIHARNELIRQSYSNNHLIDKSLQQRFRCTLIDVPDGDITGTENFDLKKIKKSKDRVPKPTRLCNGLPFHSVRTSGVDNPISIPFVKEAASKFYNYLPGMPCLPTYDYINGYLYINATRNHEYSNLGSIIIEGVFEYPFEITEEHFVKLEFSYSNLKIVDENYITNNKNEENIVDNYKYNFNYSDDDEFLISEDMINSIKKLVLETFNPQIIRDTSEIPTPNLVK